jgi:hypothetical protein
VTEADLATVLAGRDPATGARLLGAQGSAGRRPKLGVGAETRRCPTGLALYDATDAAAVLGLPAKQIHAMLDVGATVALSEVPLPPIAGTTTRYPYLGRSSGAYPGDKQGVTRRIRYTWTDEHVYKTAAQSTCRHSAAWPGGVS